MKASQYNWVLENDGRMVLFNGATGCVAVIAEESRKRVSEALGSAEPRKALARLGKDDRARLIDGGFFVERDRDERGMLRHVSLVPSRARALSGVTSVVTTRCNLACRGCLLESSAGRDMAPEVVNRMIEALYRTEAAEFTVSMCGGEPLLVPGICVEIGQRARDACARRGTKLRLSLSTNGYLLDKRMARRIAGAGVGRVRIALEGSRERHDMLRHLRGGVPTFSRIVDNVFAAAEHMEAVVHIRTDESLESPAGPVETLVKMFGRSERIRVRLVPARVGGPSEDGCVGAPILPAEEVRRKLPGCAAASPSSLILMPEGSFALCWDELGASLASCEERPAAVSVSSPSWMDWNPYGAPPCSDCRRLPTCGGGCPRVWALTGRHECAFASDEDYLRFIRTNFIRPGAEDRP
jgi:uncharacterized protein